MQPCSGFFNTMEYIEFDFTCSADFAEILMAELAEIGFETFTEEPEGLKAYVQEPDFDENTLNEVLARYKDYFEFTFTRQNIAKQNWNATWESNYAPITVANQVMVRASFHLPNEAYKYDIVINPKMSFGTGHHDTTSMMMAFQLEIEHQNKSVLDVGCGTGILAILSEKLGAKSTRGFDIEEWAAQNSVENAQINFCTKSTFVQGTIETEPEEEYDIILANINRNILLRDVPQYIQKMIKGGVLLISGFYVSDQAEIQNHFEQLGLRMIGQKQQNQWACMMFEY